MQRTQIILVDSDMRRRARVAFEMTNMSSYVLPLEDVAEICGVWPEQAVILIEDARDNIARLTRIMRREKRDLPFIAFSAAPAGPARTRARRAGAADYLAWPCEPALLHQTMLAIDMPKAPPAPATSPAPSPPQREAGNVDWPSRVVAIGDADTRGEYLLHRAAAAPRNVDGEANVLTIAPARAD